MINVIGIGDVMCDMNLTTGVMYPGGQSLNIPANVRLMGESAAFLGCLGNDGVAQYILDTMDAIGIDYSHCRRYPIPHHTSCYRVIDGDRVFVKPPWRTHPMSRAMFGMLDYEGLSDDDWDYIAGFDLVHCSNDSCMERFFPEMKARGLRLSFDFSTTYELEGYMEEICPSATFVLLSCAHRSEAETCDLLEEAHRLGAGICVGTRGGKGSICFDGQRFYRQGVAACAHVVDTMGAGDAFISAFLVNGLRRMRAGAAQADWIPQAMTAAAVYAADSCGVEGSFGYGKPFALQDSGRPRV